VHVGQEYLIFFYISQNHFFQGKKYNACEKDEISILKILKRM